MNETKLQKVARKIRREYFPAIKSCKVELDNFVFDEPCLVAKAEKGKIRISKNPLSAVEFRGKKIIDNAFPKIEMKEIDKSVAAVGALLIHEFSHLAGNEWHGERWRSQMHRALEHAKTKGDRAMAELIGMNLLDKKHKFAF